MYGKRVKKGIFACAIAALAAAQLLGMDREIPLTPGDMPPRAISAWTLRDAALERGWRGGWDIVIGPPESADAEGGPSGAQALSLDFEGPGGSDSGPWSASYGKAFNTGPGRRGSTSARFSGRDSALLIDPGASSILSPGRELRDFSIDFWIRPSTTENGETILVWKASRWTDGVYLAQEISCVFTNGRLTWNLLNCFSRAGSSDHGFRLSGRRVSVPGDWSHHRLRFDFASGLLEYLVDGIPEATAYATSTGREDGTVLLPIVGIRGRLSLGEGYFGLLDGFRISEEAAEGADLRLRAPEGAEAWSPVVDTLSPGTLLLSLAAEWKAGEGTGIEFLVRSGESYADWTEEWPAWQRAIPGQALGEPLKGRYVQARARLFTDGRAAASPRLSRLSLSIREDLPPPPPSRLLAMPGDGAVTLTWIPVMDADLGGYRVYYGTAPGEYFGMDAAEGRSPIDIGKAGSFTLSGLTNGRLYYIAVSAYDMPVDGDPTLKREGEFSAETSARPLRPAR